jgi:nitroreductase
VLELTPDELLSTTRAVRKRLDLERPVEREVLEECLRLAQQAPTGSYAQNWHFVVVTEPELRPGSPTCGGRGREVPRRDRRPGGDPGDDGRVVGGVFHLRDHLHEVPVHVIPCIEGRTDGKGVFAQASTWGSIMPAAWSFMLAARSRGLGTVWTTFHLFRESRRRAARHPVRRGDAGCADPGRLHGRYGVQAGRSGRRSTPSLHWDRW